MPYNLLDETEDFFMLHDGNESFPVAKFGLDDTTMGRIRSLPQGYADGGVVAPLPVDQSAYDPTGLYTEPASSFQVAPSAVPSDLTLETGMGSGMAAAPMQYSPNLSPVGVELGLNQPQQPQPMTAQPAVPSYMDYMSQLVGKGQQQQKMDLPSEYTQGYQTMIDASRQQAQASAQAAQEQANIYQQQIKQMQLDELARQKQEQAVQQDFDKIRNDVATQKIDPTRVWSNMSTGNRVLAGISIFLGGVAGGMQGRENSALKIINDAIDKDIDSQKAELGKKQNLLAINMQKYRNIQDAAAATKAQLMAVTQAQVNQAAAKAGSKQALAAAQMFQGQTELEMGKLKMQLAQSQMMQNKLVDPRGMSPQEAMKMNQEIQDKLVQLPNGQYYPAFNKESAVKVREAQAKLMPIKALMTEASNFMDQGYTLPITQRNTEAKRLKANILVELKNLKELGQLTEADMDIINPLVPQLGDILFQGKDRDAIASINRQIDNKLNAAYSAYIPGLNPTGRQSREQSVFGRP